MKKKKIIISSVLAIVILCIVSWIIFSLFNRPKTIFIHNLQKMSEFVFEKFEKKEEASIFKEEDKLQFDSKGTLSFSSSLKMEPMTFKMQYQLDRQNKKQRFNLDLKDSIQNLLGLDIYFTENRLYYRFKDVMEQYYFMEHKIMMQEDDFNIDDIKYLVDIILKNFDKELKHSMFKTEKDLIEIDNKTIQGKRISITFTEKMLSRIMKSSIEEMEKDSKALTILTDFLSLEKKSETKEQLNIYVAQLDDVSDEKVFTYEMFIKNYQAITQTILMDESKLEVQYYKNKAIIAISSKENDILKMNIEQKEANDYQISGSVMEVFEIKGTLTKQKNTKELLFEISSEDSDDSVFKIWLTSKEGKAKIQQQFEGTFSIGDKAFNLILDNEYQKIEKLEDINLNNSIDTSMLTEDQKQELLEKISHIPILNLFFVSPSYENEV